MKIMIAVLLLISTSAFAWEECYQLSPDGKAWSKTPETLCVETTDHKAHTFTLKTGMPNMAKVVATFNLDLSMRVKCMDCNYDEFTLLNPQNSVFSLLAIKFTGQRDRQTGKESGTVSVGATQFHYRSY